jgi:hypothetical protein
MTSHDYNAYQRDSIGMDERRNPRSPLFTLAELDPRDVIDGITLEDGYQAEDPISSGTMREVCPYCVAARLHLILRYKNVKRAHLFCIHCTRCFDALYPDGTSALAIGATVAL